MIVDYSGEKAGKTEVKEDTIFHPRRDDESSFLRYLPDVSEAFLQGLS